MHKDVSEEATPLTRNVYFKQLHLETVHFKYLLKNIFLKVPILNVYWKQLSTETGQREYLLEALTPSN